MPKILWLSPYSLHDVSSGASVDAKLMLESLVKRGFEVWSCASFVFDNPAGAVVFGDLDKLLKEDPHQTFILDDKGIHYIYTRCASRSESMFSLAEGQLLYETFLKVLDEFQPDIVFGYCPGMPSLTCFAEAKRRGISTVYLLVNANHGHFGFPNYDLVITDSYATSRLYATRDGINVVPTGAFFSEEHCVSKERDPKYITFINPVGSKGLAIFAKLAHIFKKRRPDQRFLVINSRGHFALNVPQLHIKGKKEEHPFAASNFSNVDMTGTQKDMRAVYALTKVLLAPSVAFESWGRVATEAVLNNIPVLCSKAGGLHEAIAGGGIALDVPEHTQEDYSSLPTNEEIEPWVNALERLLDDDWSVELKKAQEELSVEKATDKVIEAFKPLLAKKASNNPLYYYK